MRQLPNVAASGLSEIWSNVVRSARLHASRNRSPLVALTLVGALLCLLIALAGSLSPFHAFAIAGIGLGLLSLHFALSDPRSAHAEAKKLDSIGASIRANATSPALRDDMVICIPLSA